MTLTEFLLARIAEREAKALSIHAGRCETSPHTEPDSMGRPMSPVCDCDWHVARVLAECEAKRRIVEWHESWPTLVTTPAKFERDDIDLDNYTYRMSQEIAWMTTREYVARFGIDPPTAPILAMLALPYADHPDYPG